MSVSAMCFLIEIKFILNLVKSPFKGSYDKQDLVLVIILYEMTTRVIFSAYKVHDIFFVQEGQMEEEEEESDDELELESDTENTKGIVFDTAKNTLDQITLTHSYLETQ